MKPAFFFVLCLLPLACGTPPSAGTADDSKARTALANAGREFSAAYMRGDVDTIMDTYTDDAVLLPPGVANIEGVDNIRAYWTLPEGRVITHHRMTPDEIVVSDSIASDYGTYEIAGENNGTPWGPSYGKYMVLWRLGRDGHWRMKLDMWAARPAPDA